MKKYLTLLLALMLALSLFGCSSSESDDSTTLYFNVGYDPDTFDPQASRYLESAIIINQTVDYLYRQNLDGEYEPSLAESYTMSDDGLVYTFTLREGITFADGTAITAEDVRYSWVRALDPENAFEYASQLYYIKNGEAYNAGEVDESEVGIVVVDERTVEVTLESATAYFISLTGFTTYGIISKEFAEAQETYGDSPETTLSSGPFVVAEHVRDQYVKLEKNENYWDADSVSLEEIYIYCVEESSTEIQMFETGQLDLTYLTIPSADLTRLEEEGSLHYWSTVNTRYLQANYETEVLSDPLVRKALELALDRDAIATNVVMSAEAVTGFVPNIMSAVDDPTQAFRTETLIPTSGDVEEAQRLLAEAGYPNGEGFPTDLELLYTTDESNKAIAEAIVAMWQENLGITVTAVNLEGTVRSTRKSTGDFDFSLDGWSSDYLDPYSFLEIMTTGNAYNNSSYSNAEYDALLEVAKTATDQSVRQEAMVAAEKILIEDMAVLPLWTGTNTYLMVDTLTDVLFSELGTLDFKWAYKS